MKWMRTIAAQWRSETPKLAKRVRNAAGVAAIAIPAAYGSVTAMGIEVEPWAKQTVAVATFASTLTVGVAGTKETNNGKARRENEETGKN